MPVSTINGASAGSSGTIITTGSSGQVIPKAALPTGSVLQVVQAYKTDVFTTTASVDTDITGLTVTLTPTSSTSKFLITSFISGYSNNGLGGGFCIQRNGTKIGLADTSGSRTRTSFSGDLYTGDASGTIQMQFNSVACFLDSPSTGSSITYKVTAQCNGGDLYINREEQDSDNNDATRCVSNITVMEIAA